MTRLGGNGIQSNENGIFKGKMRQRSAMSFASHSVAVAQDVSREDIRHDSRVDISKIM